MDTRPINASLYINVFNPTGNPGEYSFTSALYNDQADETGNGAIDVQVGFVVYVPSTSFNTGTRLPGVLHRYRLTSVSALNPQTLSGVMVWDEVGLEGLEVPTNGIACGLSQSSPNLSLGYAPSDAIYPELILGSTAQSVQTDLWNQIDPHESSNDNDNLFKITIGDDSTLQFNIHHSLHSQDVSVTIYEISTKADTYAGVRRISDDDIELTFTYPIETDSHRVIVRR